MLFYVKYKIIDVENVIHPLIENSFIRIVFQRLIIIK